MRQTAFGKTNFLSFNGGEVPGQGTEQIDQNLVNDLVQTYLEKGWITPDTNQVNIVGTGGSLVKESGQWTVKGASNGEVMGVLGTTTQTNAELSSLGTDVNPYTRGSVELFDTSIPASRAAELGTFDGINTDERLRDVAGTGTHAEQFGATGAEYVVTNQASGAEAGEALMKQHSNLEAVNDKFDSLFGKSVEGVAKDLAKSEMNTTGKSWVDINNFLAENGVTTEMVNNEPLIHWGLAFNCHSNKAVAMPTIDQANAVNNFLSGTSVGTVEQNLNEYATAKIEDLDAEKDVMNYFMDAYGEDVDAVDGKLFKGFLFGAFRENKAEYKAIQENMEIATDESKPEDVRRAAAGKAWEMLHVEFDADVTEARGKMINAFEKGFEDRQVTVNGVPYQFKHNSKTDQWSLKAEGDSKFRPLEEVMPESHRQANFKRKVTSQIVGMIGTNDRVTKAYEKSMDKFAGLEAGMQEAQRDLIIATVASFRAEGISLAQMREGPVRTRMVERCTQRLTASKSVKVVDQALINQVIDQMISEQQVHLDTYLAGARRDMINPGPLRGVEKGNAGNHYHGPDITNYEQNALDQISWEYLKSVYPNENPTAPDELSSAYLIADSFARQGYQFTDAELGQAFSNMTVNTAENFGIDPETALNTSADFKAETDRETLRGNNDKLARLQPIVRQEMVVVNGREYTATVTYKLFMRAGCSNPIVQPDMRVENVVEQIAGDLVDDCTYEEVVAATPAELVARHITLPEGVMGDEVQINAMGVALKLALLALLGGGGGGGLGKVVPDPIKPPIAPGL